MPKSYHHQSIDQALAYADSKDGLIAVRRFLTYMSIAAERNNLPTQGQKLQQLADIVKHAEPLPSILQQQAH